MAMQDLPLTDDDEKNADDYLGGGTSELDLADLLVLIAGQLREMGVQEDRLVALLKKSGEIGCVSFPPKLRSEASDASPGRERVDGRPFQSLNGTTAPRARVQVSTRLPRLAASCSKTSTRKGGFVTAHSTLSPMPLELHFVLAPCSALEARKLTRCSACASCIRESLTRWRTCAGFW
jgi:hypothetical protein